MHDLALWNGSSVREPSLPSHVDDAAKVLPGIDGGFHDRIGVIEAFEKRLVLMAARRKPRRVSIRRFATAIDQAPRSCRPSVVVMMHFVLRCTESPPHDTKKPHHQGLTSVERTFIFRGFIVVPRTTVPTPGTKPDVRASHVSASEALSSIRYGRQSWKKRLVTSLLHI